MVSRASAESLLTRPQCLKHDVREIFTSEDWKRACEETLVCSLTILVSTHHPGFSFTPLPSCLAGFFETCGTTSYKLSPVHFQSCISKNQALQKKIIYPIHCLAKTQHQLFYINFLQFYTIFFCWSSYRKENI